MSDAPTITQGRGESTIRQWKLLRIIHSSNYATVESLASQLAASTKTIRRDILMLEAAGFPIRYDRNGAPHGHCYLRLDEDWFLAGTPGRAPRIRDLESKQVSDEERYDSRSRSLMGSMLRRPR